MASRSNNLTSEVWRDYFDPVFLRGGGYMAKCRICKQLLRAGNGTSQLHRHPNNSRCRAAALLQRQQREHEDALVVPAAAEPSGSGEPSQQGSQVHSAAAGGVVAAPASSAGSQLVYSTATFDEVVAAAEHLRLQQEDLNDLLIDFNLVASAIFSTDPQGGEAAFDQTPPSPGTDSGDDLS